MLASLGFQIEEFFELLIFCSRGNEIEIWLKGGRLYCCYVDCDCPRDDNHTPVSWSVKPEPSMRILSCFLEICNFKLLLKIYGQILCRDRDNTLQKSIPQCQLMPAKNVALPL